MTHDIAHCNNERCPAKDRCKRFQLYLEDLTRGTQYCNYLMLTEETKERAIRNGSCIHFLNKN